MGDIGLLGTKVQGEVLSGVPNKKGAKNKKTK
jgi:hypothetical protein